MNIRLTPPEDYFMSISRGMMNPQIRSMIAKGIKAEGVSYMAVFAGEHNPPFIYSVGLFPVLGYEVLMIGIRPSTAYAIVSGITLALVTGEIIAKDGERIEGEKNRFLNLPFMFKSVERNPQTWEKYTVQAESWWACKMPIFQIVLSDSSGKLPEDEGFNTEQMDPIQPLLYK